MLVAALEIGFYPSAKAHTQEENKSELFNLAEAITVRIEGVVQGSGVIVNRERDRYTVLTAWHVVSAQLPEDELDVYTFDGQRHIFDMGSIRRVKGLDMAIFSFTSTGSYKSAKLGDSSSLKRLDKVYVAGFPFKDESSRMRKNDFFLSHGILLANARVKIDEGYQLMYVHPVGSFTAQGMSGGPVLDARGLLVGIHGRGEMYEAVKMVYQQIEKTGRNMGMPINYYLHYLGIKDLPVGRSTPKSTDDYFMLAATMVDHRGVEYSTDEQLLAALSFISQIETKHMSSDILELKRQALWRLGRYADAIAAASASPPTFSSFHDKAIALIDSGKAIEGCNALKEAVRRFPANGTNGFPNLSHYYLFVYSMPRFQQCFVVKKNESLELDPGLPSFCMPAWSSNRPAPCLLR
jgi:hypothetical protein